MTYEQLRIFVAVAEREHITRAAKFLNLAQSGVSSAVALLERQFGLKLFHRIGRGIALTEAGKYFLEEARTILTRTHDVEIAMTEFAGLRRGRLRINATETISNYFLPKNLIEFHTYFPDIELIVETKSIAQVMRAVSCSDVDLGFIEGPIEGTKVVTEIVGSDHVIIVASPTHHWAKCQSLEIEKLAEGPWIMREPEAGTSVIFADWWTQNGIRIERVNTIITLPSNEAVRAAVEAGAGVAALSSLVCAQSLADGNIVRLKVQLPKYDFYALQHVDNFRSKAASTFLAMFKTTKVQH